MQELEEYRREIDKIDVELIDVLSRRFKVVRAVGDLKTRKNLSVVQSERAEQVKTRAAEMGRKKGLDPAFVRRLYELMIDHAHELEYEIAGKAKK